MIRFSNRVKYGLQFLLFLSIDDEEFTGIQRAAISCDIPQKFLEAIAVDLKKSGMLEVKRGAGGGYRLNKPMHDIYLADVVAVLEGMDVKSDVKSGDLIHQVVDQTLNKSVNDFWDAMRTVNLEQVQKKYSESADKLMYYI
jgi:Rrf2 family transcriptional regulator, cysteine metabolism repressor